MMSTEVQYKALPEEQLPQPHFPDGYGVVQVDLSRGAGDKYMYFPCRLLTIEKAKTSMLGWHSFGGAYHGGPLAYQSRNKAISFVYRWYRRYGEDGVLIPHGVVPCGAGVPGHLYQGGRITIAEAAERLGLRVKDIHWIRKHADLKARLESGKVSRGLFYNHYTISLAHLEAWLDTHGFKDVYANVAELRQQRPSLPYVVWCV
jgi:hypothetical protein